MGLFRGKGGGGAPMAQKQTILHALRVQTSAYGSPLPIIYGQNRVAGKLLDYQDFKAIPHTTTQHVGKGGGGQNVSNTSYTYQAAIDVAVCEGPIYSLKNVWDTSGKLTLLSSSQSYTIPGGGGTYTPTVPSS